MRLKIRIELLGVENPKVWREMWVPMGITFDTLHRMLQEGIGWKDYHLYSFQESLEGMYFHIMSPPIEDVPGIDATKIIIDNILWGYYDSYQMSQDFEKKRGADKLYYVYDFGDQWEHEIMVIDYDATPTKYAEITNGEGACPPEDSGGHHGYKRTKDYLAGKMGKEEYYDWFSAVDAEGLDVFKFDMVMHNKMLRRMR